MSSPISNVPQPIEDTGQDAAAGTRALQASLSLDNSRLFALAVALSALPLWIVTYLPIVDLAGHAAQVTSLELVLGNAPLYAEEYYTNWFTPYLLGYALLYALSTIMPITIATKVVVTAGVVLAPVMTACLLREIRADTRWAWLAIPGSYSLAFYWGFVSYLIAIPVGLGLLILTLRFERNPSLRGGLVVALVAALSFFCHVILTGLACMFALVYLAAGNYGSPKRLALLWLPYTAPIPLILAWLLLSSNGLPGITGASLVYGSLPQRLSTLAAQPAGFESLSPLGILITSIVFVLPPLCGSRISRRPERWLPFTICLLAYAAAPSSAFGVGFLSERIGAFLVPLWLIAWDPPTRVRFKLGWLAIVAVALWLGLNASRFASFSQETRSFDAVLERMDPEKYVASLIVENASPLFATPVYLHFPNWYQAQKGGTVEFSFSDFPLLVRRTDVTRPRVDEWLSWQPWQFDWTVHGGDQYDYFLVRASVDLAEPIFKNRRDSVELVVQSGWWWLYRNLER